MVAQKTFKKTNDSLVKCGLWLDTVSSSTNASLVHTNFHSALLSFYLAVLYCVYKCVLLCFCHIKYIYGIFSWKKSKLFKYYFIQDWSTFSLQLWTLYKVWWHELLFEFWLYEKNQNRNNVFMVEVIIFCTNWLKLASIKYTRKKQNAGKNFLVIFLVIFISLKQTSVL